MLLTNNLMSNLNKGVTEHSVVPRVGEGVRQRAVSAL